MLILIILGDLLLVWMPVYSSLFDGGHFAGNICISFFISLNSFKVFGNLCDYVETVNGIVIDLNVNDGSEVVVMA